MNKEKEMRGHLINMKVKGNNNNLSNKVINNNEDRINREIEYNKNINNLILEQRDLNNQQINYFNNKDYENESKRQYNMYLNELEKEKNKELNNKLNEEEYLKYKEEYNKNMIKNPEIINQINNEELNYNQQLKQINNYNIPINQNNINEEYKKEQINQQFNNITNINNNDLEYINKKENITNEINTNKENIPYNETIPNIKKDDNINLNEMSKYERLQFESYLREKEGKNFNPEQLKNYELISQEQPKQKLNNIEDEKKLILSSQNIINKRDDVIIKDPYTTKSYNIGNTNLEKNIISHTNNHHYHKTFNNCLVNGNRIISGRLQYAGNKIIG